MARTLLRILTRFLTAGLAVVLLLPGPVGAGAAEQDPPPPPGARRARPDTMNAALQDTTRTGRGHGYDRIVAEYVSLSSDGTTTTFRGSPEKPAWVRMQDIEVKAGIIIYDQENEWITALPLPDTSATGQAGGLHRPLFIQADQQLVGTHMFYDLNADKGQVWSGDTTYEFGYYHGDIISAYRSQPNYLTVRQARFTTCDLEHPHYYFSAEKMKIIPEDKVIARGIRFNLLGLNIPPRLFTIPGLDLEIFPPLPFLIKSIRSGRQSGLLMPRYSSNTLTGVTLKDVGYYWAPSPYFDLRAAADITEKQGVILRARTRYALRYRLQGNVEVNYNYNRQTRIVRWETRFNHNQTLSPTTRLTARGNFTSSKDFNTALSDDLDRRLQRILRSHVNFSQRLEGGGSFAATASQTRYLDRDVTNTQLPTISLRLPRRPLFGIVEETGPAGAPGGLRGLGPAAGVARSTGPVWYENFYFSYSANFRAQTDDRLIDASDPSLGNETTSQTGLEQRADLNYAGKAFGWLNLQPGFSAREAWYMGDTAEEGFQRRLTWNSNLRASTKLYGLAEEPFGINASFRHVVEPSLTFSYAPDFTDLPDVPNMFGANPGPQQRFAFQLGQIFQMKRLVGEEERKTDLARVTTGLSYNEQSSGRKLSDVTSSLVTNAGRVLNLQFSTVHSFYAPGTDELQWTPVAVSARYRSSLRLDSATLARWFSRTPAETEAEAEEDVPEEAAGQEQAAAGEDTPYGLPTREASDLTRPGADRARTGGRRWNLTVNHSYQWVKDRPEPTHSLDGSLTVNLPRWTLTTSARYDVTGRELIRHTISIYRDLHCWEARLQVVTRGPGRGYWFVIAITDIPEIKYERRRTVF